MVFCRERLIWHTVGIINTTHHAKKRRRGGIFLTTLEIGFVVGKIYQKGYCNQCQWFQECLKRDSDILTDIYAPVKRRLVFEEVNFLELGSRHTDIPSNRLLAIFTLIYTPPK